MLAREDIAAILCRELFAIVEGHLQGGGMRLEQYVWQDGFGPQFGMLASQSRILMGAQVVPGPSIKAAFFYVTDVIRNQVVAQAIPLVDRAPQLSRGRIHGNSGWIANARRINLHEFAFRRIFQNVGTMGLA